MRSTLNKGQIEDLVTYCGSSPTHWRGNNMQICCPVHNETNSSMGVSEDKQVCHCFSCGFKGDFAWLLYKSLPDEFRSYHQARTFLKDRYELEYRELNEKTRNVSRYEDTFEKYQNVTHRKEIPLYKIAPFMSGKQTFAYFYERGFDSSDVKKFKIGRDLENKTVTIPVFYEDNKLAGVIGRYISPNRKKNERYKIYEFERGSTLYPMNHFKCIDDTIILVEGQFDAIKMHKYGYENTLAKMGVELTPKQANIICENCSRVIYVCDNDERSLEAREKDKKLLGDRVKFMIVDYPNYGKDSCDWSKEDIDLMIGNAHSPSVRKLRRL